MTQSSSEELTSNPQTLGRKWTCHLEPQSPHSTIHLLQQASSHNLSQPCSLGEHSHSSHHMDCLVIECNLAQVFNFLISSSCLFVLFQKQEIFIVFAFLFLSILTTHNQSLEFSICNFVYLIVWTGPAPLGLSHLYSYLKDLFFFQWHHLQCSRVTRFSWGRSAIFLL